MKRFRNGVFSQSDQRLAALGLDDALKQASRNRAVSDVPIAMKAAVIVRPGAVKMRKVPVPVPESNQLLVRIEGCGVCASNIPSWEGRPWFQYPLAPGQLGHEGWGRIVQVGEETCGFHLGDRIGF